MNGSYKCKRRMFVFHNRGLAGLSQYFSFVPASCLHDRSCEVPRFDTEKLTLWHSDFSTYTYDILVLQRIHESSCNPQGHGPVCQCILEEESKTRVTNGSQITRLATCNDDNANNSSSSSSSPFIFIFLSLRFVLFPVSYLPGMRFRCASLLGI